MSLKRQLQELQAATEAEARRLPPDEAREVRAASLAQARELATRTNRRDRRSLERCIASISESRRQ